MPGSFSAKALPPGVRVVMATLARVAPTAKVGALKALRVIGARARAIVV